MANLRKLNDRKKLNRLGPPPSVDEASTNIFSPEVAPIPTDAHAEAEELPVSPAEQLADASAEPTHYMSKPASTSRRRPENREPPGTTTHNRIDGRALRRTGRTVPMGTRVSEAFHQRLRMVAQRDNLLIVELLERALEAYEFGHKKKR